MTFVDPIVSATWLKGQLANVAVVDVRWSLVAGPSKTQNLENHIPGARFANLDSELSQAPGPGRPGRHPLPHAEQFAQLLSRLGVDDKRVVVAYDDLGGAIAARFWWLMRYFGLNNARVLDGGIQAWQAAGFEQESGEVADANAPPPALTPQPHRVVNAAEVMHLRSQDDVVMLDARAGARYRGEHEPVDARAGHIPGARSAPFVGNLQQPRGHFRPIADTSERFTALGIDNTKRTVNYCGSGVTACHNILALERAGFENALLYPGSWSDWASQPNLPLETTPSSTTPPKP